MVCLPAEESEYVRACSSSAHDSFDVEVAITGFLADVSRASIELPRTLSADQRKHAKKIIEQYPNLKCESFGLGEERQMHVFKRNVSDSSPGTVRVKNTFIDDWIPDQPADGRIVQSMPHNMFAQRLSAEISGNGCATATVEESPVANGSASPYSHIAESPVSESCQIPLGTEVVIDGLVKAPQFNGAAGTVDSFDADTHRYNIYLTVATSGGQHWAKVKGDNLRLLGPPTGTISFGEL